MNIGDVWDSKNWDDAPLEPEELEKTLEIHRRHRDKEGTRSCTKSISETPNQTDL